MKNIRFLQSISNKILRQSFLLSLRSPVVSYDKRRNIGQTSFKETSDKDGKTMTVMCEEDVLIKYRNIINNMTSLSETSDVCHKTNFGSIRFDDDNPPMEYFRENKSNTESSDKTDATSNVNFIDDYYFESALINCEKLKTTSEYSEKYLDIPNENSIIKSHNDNLDLNYVDSQYLSNYPENDSNKQIQNISTEDFHNSDMNLVDKQYFINNSKSDPMNFNNCVSLHNENFNESLIKSQLSMESDNIAYSGLHSFAQAIDEDFELPLDLNSTLKTKPLNRSQLETDLLTLSESLSASKAEQNISKPPLKENSASQLSSTIIKDKIKKTVPVTYDDAANNGGADKTFYSTSPSTTQNALEYVTKKRLEDKMNLQSENNELTNKFMKIINEVPVYKSFLKYDFTHMLRKSILYNDNDIIAILKPYGVPTHGGDKDKYGKRSAFTIVDSLPDLAQMLKIEQIIPVHRLDVNTTGVLLLAKSYSMADTLKKLFKDNEIKKSYLAITKGIPSPVSGVINIPIAEGKVENHVRMVLKPDIPGFRGKSRQAITHFKVLSRANNSALVMLNPINGIKHQLRVHLGFGLACPVLGDHKYSHLKKMVPQKLPGDMLDHLQVKQTRVRDLPMYLHAFSVTIPNILESRDLFVRVGPPKFFKTTMRYLELNKSLNHINEVPELIFSNAN